MPFDREKFSNRLAALRAERGLDQAGLAERAGVSRDSIARYETGGAVPNLESACRLAEALDCGLDVLAGIVSITGR